MFDRYTYISMYLITSVYIHSVIQWFYFIAILEIIKFFFVQYRLFLKVKQMVNTIKNLIIVCFE